MAKKMLRKAGKQVATLSLPWTDCSSLFDCQTPKINIPQPIIVTQLVAMNTGNCNRSSEAANRYVCENLKKDCKYSGNVWSKLWYSIRKRTVKNCQSSNKHNRIYAGWGQAHLDTILKKRWKVAVFKRRVKVDWEDSEWACLEVSYFEKR